jgi:hypothetical protein
MAVLKPRSVTISRKLARRRMLSRLPRRIAKPKREAEQRSSPAHRAWVRRHHCSVPNCERLPIECAHVRRGSDGGTGLKPSDRFVISLCNAHHAEQHRIGEWAFEQKYGLDLLAISEAFARRSPHWKELEVMR